MKSNTQTTASKPISAHPSQNTVPLAITASDGRKFPVNLDAESLDSDTAFGNWLFGEAHGAGLSPEQFCGRSWRIFAFEDGEWHDLGEEFEMYWDCRDYMRSEVVGGALCMATGHSLISDSERSRFLDLCIALGSSSRGESE